MQKRSSKRYQPARAKKRTGSKRAKKKTGGALPGITVLLALIVVCGILWMGWQKVSGLLDRIRDATAPADHPAYCAYDSESFSVENGLAQYNDENYITYQGIDVSSHQGEIDWQAASEGLDFAIVRAGWRGYSDGAISIDENCMTNLQGARDNGLKVGVYFYSQAITPEEAEEEARQVLAVLDGFDLDMPVYYDWELPEQDDARTQGLDFDTLTECAVTFCETIENHGYDAGIYFYRALGENEYDLTQLDSYDHWLSQPGSSPDFLYTFSLWQYTLDSDISGIDYPVDRDLLIVPADS